MSTVMLLTPSPFRIDFPYQSWKLHDAFVFPKCDLRASYQQIRVHDEDINKIGFRTVDNHYEFQVRLFDLSNAPLSFQVAINDIFLTVLRHIVLVFFDDILIYSRSREQHHEHLRIVFQMLAQHRYYPKLSKCIFGVYEIQYLGHVISLLIRSVHQSRKIESHS